MKKTFALLILFLVLSLPVSAQTSVPTPFPTLPALPTEAMFQEMATANAILADAPVDLSRPDNIPILPGEDGRQLFGYIKWLTSPATADEWAGPFAPIFQHIGVGIVITFALATVYSLIYVVANAGSWVLWLTEQARKILDLVFQAAQAWPLLVIIGIAMLVAAILSDPEAARDFVVEQSHYVGEWANCFITAGSCLAGGGP